MGEILSLTAALAWAVGVILFRKIGETTSAVALNLFKNVVTVALLVFALVLAGLPLFPDRPRSDWLLLAGSGVLGISLADTLFFLALERLGAGLVAVVDTLYSPSVIGLSVLFLGERFGLQVLVGAALVVGAILTGSADRPPPGSTRRDIVVGTILGAAAMICTACGIVMVKEMLGTVPVLWAAAVRMTFGVAGLLPLMLVPRWRSDAAAIFLPSRAWGLAIPASVLGSCLSMTAWLAGYKYTLASVAAVLNQLSTIFIVVLAAIFLKEPMTPRRTLAVAMAVTGAVLVTIR
ncbi:MAG: DMT family transporter [Acidobacteriia bacterium]|nr:DMT family transporter [Terriglobia bacterium]